MNNYLLAALTFVTCWIIIFICGLLRFDKSVDNFKSIIVFNFQQHDKITIIFNISFATLLSIILAYSVL